MVSHLRAAEEDDIGEILGLIERVYPEGYPKTWASREGLEPAIGDFVVAEEDNSVVGTGKANDEYWPGAVYIESIMVDPDSQGQGLGTDIVDELGNLRDETLVSLDRSTSAGIFLGEGYLPAAFLPEREYFGDRRESLMVTYRPGNKHGKTWEKDLRVKSRDDEPYLVEITGTDLSEQIIQESIEELPSTYLQVINYVDGAAEGLSLDQEGLKGGKMEK